MALALAGLGWVRPVAAQLALATNQPREPARVMYVTNAVRLAFTNLPPPTATAPAVADPRVKQLGEAGLEALRRERPEEALRIFDEALKLDPTNRSVRFGIGTAYIKLERYKEAFALLEAMSRENPADYFLKNNLAWMYATAKDHSLRNGAKAVALARDALLLAPKDYHVWSTLAESYYILGQYDKALRAAEQALQLAQQTGNEATVKEYRAQIRKFQRAAEAMSIFE